MGLDRGYGLAVFYVFTAMWGAFAVFMLAVSFNYHGLRTRQAKYHYDRPGAGLLAPRSRRRDYEWLGSRYVRCLDLIVFGVATFGFVYLVVGIITGKG